MTTPREIYEDSAYMVTRSCAFQQYLLRPDAETNNIVIYCLGVAAQRYDVQVIDFNVLSNHIQYTFFDRGRNAPEFVGYFHRLLAKCMNALRGRRENFFSSEPVSLVRLEGRGDAIEKTRYVVTNAVEHGLVSRAEEWPGAHGFEALVSGKPLHATRPTCFFADDGKMPETVTLHLAVPPELGDPETFIAELCRRKEVFEADFAAKRKAAGKAPLGAAAALKQSWKTIPPDASTRKRKEPGEISPTIAAKDADVRKAAIERKLRFVAAYREARRAMLAGKPIPFPAGTYWLVRFAGAVALPVSK